MRYAIISDIHSNLVAFEAVLSHLSGIDKIICLGDIIGYGPNPNECVEKVMELKIQSIAGNHEKVLLGEINIANFTPNAGAAILWTQVVIKADNLQYLRGLPLEWFEDDFQCVHGSLRDPAEEYIESLGEALPTMERMSRPLCFVGHSHKPLFFARKRDGKYEGRPLLDGEAIKISDYEKVIINPGGVGQPRDGDPRASFGIYDSEGGIFALYRIPYDIGKTQSKMRKTTLPIRLIARLSFGV